MAQRMFVVAALLILAASPSFAAERTVPSVLGFHAALTDEGGNPLADGETAVTFRITDASGTILYEEHQEVSAVGGRIAALVGNGLTGDGAPTGGVPIELLDPREGRYLQVEVSGMAPLPLMELASVPYAAYAQEALGVAKGGVAFEDLSQAALEDLGKALTGGAGTASIVVQEELAAPEAAAAIGVAPGLTYSSSTVLQNVLGDLDGAIAAEAGARASADGAQASARPGADAAEAAARASEDYGLNKRLAAVEDPARLSFTRSAWGSVTLDGNLNPVLSGANATVVRQSLGVYRVSFTQAMADASYAVTVTPASNVGSGGAVVPLAITNKTADGFTVGLGTMINQSFDFMVFGR